MTRSLYPPKDVARTVNPDGARAAGPLLYGWSRRTARSMASTPRQVQALVNYMPAASASTFTALGGERTLEWARLAVQDISDDAPPPEDGYIHVLGLPYGGPNGGKDSEGHYFSPMTDFMDGIIDTPAVMYTHGAALGLETDPVGTVVSRWYDRQGGWFKVKLDPQGSRYHQLMEAHRTGNLRASTGAVPAAWDVDEQSGHINTWLVGELSLVDLREGYAPVNGYAITKANIIHKAAEILYEDYYGDPVMEINGGVLQTLKNLFAQVLALISAHEQEMGSILKADVDYGGKKRSELDDSDFVFPDERAFPVVTADDLKDAISSWGRYEGEHSFEDFKSKLLALAKRKGLEASLPDTWKEEMSTEKCDECEEARTLADAIRAELNEDAEGKKCKRCPEAMRLIRSYVKAGKLAPTEAFAAVDRFSESDTGLDAWQAEVEARTITSPSIAPAPGLIPIKAEQLLVAGGQPAKPVDQRVDNDHMNRQRRLVGLAEVK